MGLLGGEMSEFTPVRSWSFSRSSTKNLVIFKGKNQWLWGYPVCHSLSHWQKEDAALCFSMANGKCLGRIFQWGLVAEVNYMCISTAAGALWASMWAEKGALASRWSWSGCHWCWPTKLEDILWIWLQNCGVQGGTLKDHSSSHALACF